MRDDIRIMHMYCVYRAEEVVMDRSVGVMCSYSLGQKR